MFTDLILCKEHFSDLGFDKVISVNIIEPATKKELRKKLKQESGLRVVLGSANNRTVAETKKVDILLSPEKGVKKDSLHHRNSGLDTVICGLAKKNSIAIGFNFNDILTNEGTKRAEIIGRMMQNVWLCRKYKLRMVLGSFAKDKWQMRARNDLISFGIILGMHPAEAKKSLEAISEILKEKKEKKFVICEGVKQL
ncbi:MAG: RNase P subunit p30 family protein [Nanoarchaeota archaeon]|nr:RNase P subunit p30 family protein [Nanoarchaeota archaeon]